MYGWSRWQASYGTVKWMRVVDSYSHPSFQYISYTSMQQPKQQRKPKQGQLHHLQWVEILLRETNPRLVSVRPLRLAKTRRDCRRGREFLERGSWCNTAWEAARREVEVARHCRSRDDERPRLKGNPAQDDEEKTDCNRAAHTAPSLSSLNETNMTCWVLTTHAYSITCWENFNNAASIPIT